jgi:protoheme ferro-lyase
LSYVTSLAPSGPLKLITAWDKRNNRIHDTLEDCVMEIEELKNELSLIVISQSQNGRERWDTPDTKSGKKNKLRKDRYSALIMANHAARQLNTTKIKIEFENDYYNTVGFANGIVNDVGQDYYSGPAWFSENAKY